MKCAEQDASLCPACRRYIGPLDICPYCDCPSNKPISLKALRIVSLVLAVGGMIALFAWAQGRESPVVPISDIGPAMNFARITVTGQVESVSRPRRGVRTDYISFRVADGSNTLNVAAWGDCAAEFADGDLLPRRGDLVEVTGAITTSASGRKRMGIDSPADLQITRHAARKSPRQ